MKPTCWGWPNPFGLPVGAPYRVSMPTTRCSPEPAWVTATCSATAASTNAVRVGLGPQTRQDQPRLPANIRHLAKGTNPGRFGADLVSYDTESGAGSFRSVRSVGHSRSPSTTGQCRTANALRGMLE
ncbi:MAG: hypothetical protein Ct9H300mP1_17580 [Planctomycetaceae bacterium]|nr:MAG: hypothetical protein Ct9H300mP1_17580 [Planctomycetaceae bacterium]